MRFATPDFEDGQPPRVRPERDARRDESSGQPSLQLPPSHQGRISSSRTGKCIRRPVGGGNGGWGQRGWGTSERERGAGTDENQRRWDAMIQLMREPLAGRDCLSGE
ncbi:unnamed protein product [Protopolystoma xenopodis]|uniref:Uncharacterized protein n=1 Tax=Protopolystoma xenopodis TaxID=117903 RepID=A0A448X4C8_9PLAT|nr:unnamed protein product [Protopolystoma xenopodis]